MLYIFNARFAAGLRPQQRAVESCFMRSLVGASVFARLRESTSVAFTVDRGASKFLQHYGSVYTYLRGGWRRFDVPPSKGANVLLHAVGQISKHDFCVCIIGMKSTSEVRSFQRTSEICLWSFTCMCVCLCVHYMFAIQLILLHTLSRRYATQNPFSHII